MRDVIVIGGGPAGLSAAAALAARGLDAVVLERRALPVDKACGEGLLPGGVRALEALGATGHLDPDGWSRLRAIRWIQEDGSAAEARLPAPGGMGIRRLALSAALAARARAAGAEIREEAAVEGAPAGRRRGDRGARLRGGDCGAGSWSRPTGSPRRSGSGRGSRGRPAPLRRFGLRRHFAIAPWTDAVEVHFSPGVEAYVTPVGPHRVGLAFLFEEGTAPGFEAAAGPVPGARLPARGSPVRLDAGRGRAARPEGLRPGPPPAGPRRGRRRLRRRHHRRGGVARAGGGGPARRVPARRRSPGARPGRRSCPGRRAVRARHRRHAAVTRPGPRDGAPPGPSTHRGGVARRAPRASSTRWSPAPSGSRRENRAHARRSVVN